MGQLSNLVKDTQLLSASAAEIDNLIVLSERAFESQTYFSLTPLFFEK